MRSTLLLVAALPACGVAYQPSSFSGRLDFDGERATVGCLDVAVDIAYEVCPPATPVSAYSSTTMSACPTDPVATFDIGNRCDRAAVVDFSAVTFVARPGDHRVRLFDPLKVVERGVVDGRSSLRERFELVAGKTVPTMVCADLSALTEPAQPGRTVCSAVSPPRGTGSPGANL